MFKLIKLIKMKKTILSLVILLSISIKAQTTYPLSNYDTKNLKNNNYIKDTEGVLNPFVGTWEWTNGSNTTFRVVLTKKEHWNASGFNKFYSDEILGGYRYIENGTLIVDRLTYTTDFTSDTSTWAAFSSILGSVSYPETTKLKISIYDKLKSKSCLATMVMEVSQNGGLQAHWVLFDHETGNFSGATKQQGFSIPTDVILTKLP